MSKVTVWVLIFMAYMSLLLLGIMDNIRGPFYPDILTDLDLNGTRGSLFYAAASFSALGGNFLGSLWIRFWSAPLLTGISTLTMGFGFFAIGRSSDFSSLIASCALFGVSFGLLNVAQNVVVQENAPERYRRRIFNGLHSMYGISALAAPLAASVFVRFGSYWKQTFMILGSVSAVFGILFICSTLYLHARGHKKEAVKRETLKDFTTAGLLIFAMGFYLLAELSLSTRLPLWLRREYGASVEDANLYMAYFCLGLLLSRMLFTFVSFHRWPNAVVLLLSTGLSFAFYALGLVIHPLWSTFAGFSMGPFFPVVMDEISKRFGSQASRVIGASITLGSVMIVLMHFSLGVLTDWQGISTALWIGPFGLAVSFSLCLVLWRRSRAT